MRAIALSLCAALLTGISSGCCCLGHNLQSWSPLSCGGPCCGTHYLEPFGAQYGAYCGQCYPPHGPYGPACGKLFNNAPFGGGLFGLGNPCCHKAGCGEMYWGDLHNVPPTADPCDHHGNYIGPHYPHGSTPSYYGPLPPPPHLAKAPPATASGTVTAKQAPAQRSIAKKPTPAKPPEKQ